ncbi:MAG TPA: carbamoyltransferase HypF [Pyrinomonadaceae bacterium]|nr:carbamoyltransferase HypF [Pyrinomonadaceae bacterium]
MAIRTQIQVRGIVQGVGFRPYVFCLATASSLRGHVFNNATGVLIDVEGESHSIESFITALRSKPPPLSIIESVASKSVNLPAHFPDFRIVESDGTGAQFVPISADIATCADCLREMFDPLNRRYRYPFINCINCGPRFTIIERIPYDRARTTMREFDMCSACRVEYEDPSNRRFHAEPTCCADCGPTIVLSPCLRGPHAATKSVLNADFKTNAINNARQRLTEGKILAVKGIGGYHLVCDALNSAAVETLRNRKYREDKPFALMAYSIAVIEKYCYISQAEKELLWSWERPIVLLGKRPAPGMSDAIAPGVNSLGFMLPYTPLHYLLLEDLDLPLVMTSGNMSDEPIVYTDEDAGQRLGKIADQFLWHNRRIHIRMDDSVTRVPNNPTANAGGSALILRRSRGHAPAPAKTSLKFDRQILACGAELKNTFCLTKGSYAFISHHIGDLENLETLNSFTEGIDHYQRIFNLAPEIIAYDLHPEYLSTKYALACDEIAYKIGVQHHHAHIASCMADNGFEGKVIGVAMDGLGFGTDGKLWGGEFFVADFANADRIAHLDYIPMPGGAKAIREPWRLAAIYLQRAFGGEFLGLDLPFVRKLDRHKWSTLSSMIASNSICPETSSMGRLFDAVSALLGIRNVVNYEGQAAIELEAAADTRVSGGYEFGVADSGIIETEPVIKGVVEDILNGRPPGEVSAKFHLGVASLIADIATQIRDEQRLNRVALSGGVFQNMFLLQSTSEKLRKRDFEVLTHSRVPCNDGGISLGQAAIANARWKLTP